MMNRLDGIEDEANVLLPKTAQRLSEGGTAPIRPVMHNSLIIWVVYYNEVGYPGKYILRPFRIKAGVSFPLAKMLVLDSLEEARDVIPLGLTRVEPDPTDPKEIVESWI